MEWTGRIDKYANPINVGDIVIMVFKGMGGEWEHEYIVKLDDKGFYFDENGKRIDINKWESSMLEKKKISKELLDVK